MSASKKKGTWWESAVVGYLQTWWSGAERRALSGVSDKGDVSGLPGIVIECKNERAISLAGYLDEAEAEARNAGADFGCAWIHRRGRSSPAAGYVVISGETFVKLLRGAGW